LKIDGMLIEDVVTASGDISIKEAIHTLYIKHIGSIVIIDKERKCKGIFTERDAIRVVASDIPLSTPLEEVMTTNLMKSHNIRHLPVTDKQGHLIGLLSFRTVLDEVHDIR
jgi:CBS domain-containing protein